jgi:hypothetical protein
MRFRLTVQRNRLPDANIVWSVPETNSSPAYTVARLLEDVNRIIPLEAEHWGLEHYVVEIGGFECLHFSPVAQALKEDDHVSHVSPRKALRIALLTLPASVLFLLPKFVHAPSPADTKSHTTAGTLSTVFRLDAHILKILRDR